MSSSTGLITHRNDLVIDNIRFEFRDVDFLSDSQEYILDLKSDFVYTVSAITIQVDTGTTMFNLKRYPDGEGAINYIFNSNQTGTTTSTKFITDTSNKEISIGYKVTLYLTSFSKNPYPTLIRGSMTIIKRPGNFNIPT